VLPRSVTTTVSLSVGVVYIVGCWLCKRETRCRLGAGEGEEGEGERKSVEAAAGADAGADIVTHTSGDRTAEEKKESYVILTYCRPLKMYSLTHGDLRVDARHGGHVDEDVAGVRAAEVPRALLEVVLGGRDGLNEKKK
jgi:hypothetical protein